MNRVGRRNNYNNRGYKPSQPKEPFEEIQGAAFFLGKLNKNHDREHIYNELKKLTRVHNFYIRKLDMPYADKARRAGNMGYAFVHTKSAEQAKRIVAMKTLKLGHQVCEVKVYGGRNEEQNSSTSEAFSGRTTPELEVGGFVNPLKIEAEPVHKPTIWGRAKIVDIVRPRTDSGCQTRNVSECEENNKSEAININEEELAVSKQEENLYDQQVSVVAESAETPTPLYQNQLELDLALVRNHVGDSQIGVDLFMNYCDEIYQLLKNAPKEVILQTAQIAQIHV